MAPSSPRGGAALMALAVASVIAPRAVSAAFQVTAYSCQDVNNAFTTFGQQIAAATKPQTQGMSLTFACNGTFVGCSVSTLSYAPPALPKQPPITIAMQPESKCRKGDARPLLVSTGPTTLLFLINSASIGASPVAVTVSDLTFDGPAFRFKLPKNVTTSVTFKNVKMSCNLGTPQDYPIWVESASRLTVSGSIFQNFTDYPPILSYADQATFTGNTFTGTNAGFIEMFPLVPKARYTASRNTFSNAGPSQAGVVYIGFADAPDARFRFSGNKFNASSLNNPVICARQINGPVNTTTIILSGNKGINPNKPWGTTNFCNYATINKL